MLFSAVKVDLTTTLWNESQGRKNPSKFPGIIQRHFQYKPSLLKTGFFVAQTFGDSENEYMCAISVVLFLRYNSLFRKVGHNKKKPNEIKIEEVYFYATGQSEKESLFRLIPHWDQISRKCWNSLKIERISYHLFHSCHISLSIEKKDPRGTSLKMPQNCQD